MNPRELRLRGKITIMSAEELIAEGIDGITRVRDKLAFKKPTFSKNDDVIVTVEIIADKNYIDSIIRHPTKVWFDINMITIVGVVNEISHGGFGLKELKAGESPFMRIFYWDEKGWISNNKYLEDFDVSIGDIVKIQVRKKT